MRNFRKICFSKKYHKASSHGNSPGGQVKLRDHIIFIKITL